MQAESRLINPSEYPSSPDLDSKNNSTPQQAKAPGSYRVIRRNGTLTGFDQIKINIAITKAFRAVEDGNKATTGHLQKLVSSVTDHVVETLIRRKPGGGSFDIEEIQDQVELCLVRAGHYQVARAYMHYRETRAKARAEHSEEPTQKLPCSPGVKVKRADSDGTAPYTVLTQDYC